MHAYIKWMRALFFLMCVCLSIHLIILNSTVVKHWSRIRMVDIVPVCSSHQFVMKDQGTDNYTEIYEPTKETEERFQPISNRTHTFMYVFSAYYEKRLSHIRVICLRKKIHPPLFCVLRYSNNSVRFIEAEVPERWPPGLQKLGYAGSFVLCSMKGLEVPSSLAISTSMIFNNASNQLSLKTVPEDQVRRYFTVCVSPIHSNFNDSVRLLEWIEVNIALGVDRFYFYVQSCSTGVLEILQHFQRKRYVVIIDWPLPEFLYKTDRFVHYFGQRAALNDCLYRTKGYSEYISVLDLDEFIVPQREKDKRWTDIIHSLPKHDAYIFRNVFFVINNSTDEPLITQQFFTRHNYTYEAHKKSKFIAITDRVTRLGIHFPREMNGTEYTVSPDIGLLHHYRKEIINRYHDGTYLRNEVMKKYASELNYIRQIGLK